MTAIITSIALQKGGVGKSTTALSLAQGLALNDKKVLVIDLDPSQCTLSLQLLPNYSKEVNKDTSITRTILNQEPLCIHTTEYENLDICPAHISVTAADAFLAGAMDIRQLRLKRAIDEIIDEYDHIIIDCPPGLGIVTMNALSASNEYILPVRCSSFDIEAIKVFNDTLRVIKENYNPNLLFRGVLVTMKQPTKEDQYWLDFLKSNFKDKLFNSIIPSNVAMKESQSLKKSIFEHSPKAPSANAYRNLISELRWL